MRTSRWFADRKRRSIASYVPKWMFWFWRVMYWIANFFQLNEFYSTKPDVRREIRLLRATGVRCSWNVRGIECSIYYSAGLPGVFWWCSPLTPVAPPAGYHHAEADTNRCP